jgi:peptide/nickel transport system permease protein
MAGAVAAGMGHTLRAGTLLCGALVGSFLLFQVAPGNPARVILGVNASEEAVAQLSAQLGTDRPLPEQLFNHFEKISRLDLGRSIIDGRSVTSELADKFAVTARLGILAAAFALLGSYVINLLAFYARSALLIRLVNLGVVVPTFFTGLVTALVFGVWFPVISLSGYGTSAVGWPALLLPAAVAALYPTALMTRLLHEKMADAEAADPARALTSFGFSRWHIFHRALLRPSAVTWLSAWVNQLSTIFVAGFVLEVIFSIAGIGPLLIRTIQSKDYPMLQGIILANAFFFIGLSWLAEIIFLWLDPRVGLDAAS